MYNIYKNNQYAVQFRPIHLITRKVNINVVYQRLHLWLVFETYNVSASELKRTALEVYVKLRKGVKNLR